MLHELAITDLGIIHQCHLLLGPGVTVVTGETGAGKTMVLRSLIEGLDGSNVITGHLVTTQLGAEDTLRRIVEDVAGHPAPSVVSVLKYFGAANPGPLSFPGPGWTFTIDVPTDVGGLAGLLDRLDRPLPRGPGDPRGPRRVHPGAGLREDEARLARLDVRRPRAAHGQPHGAARADLRGPLPARPLDVRCGRPGAASWGPRPSSRT